jgi:Holliday junction resolvase RusA-like endonuclease
MSYWTFTIPGEPIPQPRPRVSTVGGFARAYVPAKHPIHGYRQRVEQAAINAGIRSYRGGPLVAEVLFAFERPKSHLTKAGQVKPRHAEAVPPGDIDNLEKSVLDAINELIGNDKRVVDMHGSKRWRDNGGPGYTQVKLAELGSMAEINTEAA